MVESSSVEESTSYCSINDVFESIVENLVKNKSGIAYMKLNWKRSEYNDDLIETQVDIDFHYSDVDAIH